MWNYNSHALGICPDTQTDMEKIGDQREKEMAEQKQGTKVNLQVMDKKEVYYL